MTKPRDILTAAAEHLADLGHLPASVALGAYRDLKYPAPRVMHKWKWLNPAGVDRRCVKCTLTEEFRQFPDGGPWVTVYIHPDGTVTPWTKTPLPKCTQSELEEPS